MLIEKILFLDNQKKSKCIIARLCGTMVRRNVMNKTDYKIYKTTNGRKSPLWRTWNSHI